MTTTFGLATTANSKQVQSFVIDTRLKTTHDATLQLQLPLPLPLSLPTDRHRHSTAAPSQQTTLPIQKELNDWVPCHAITKPSYPHHWLDGSPMLLFGIHSFLGRLVYRIGFPHPLLHLHPLERLSLSSISVVVWYCCIPLPYFVNYFSIQTNAHTNTHTNTRTHTHTHTHTHEHIYTRTYDAFTVVNERSSYINHHILRTAHPTNK